MVRVYFREKYGDGAALGFHRLHSRLVALLREKVRGGELTERGLARLSGISQPHIHNVLSGKRALSMAMADQLLGHLHLDLLDLLLPDELALVTRPRPAVRSEPARVPFLVVPPEKSDG